MGGWSKKMDNKTVIFGGNGYIGSVIKAKAANAKINLLSPIKKQLNLFDKIAKTFDWWTTNIDPHTLKEQHSF